MVGSTGLRAWAAMFSTALMLAGCRQAGPPPRAAATASAAATTAATRAPSASDDAGTASASSSPAPIPAATSQSTAIEASQYIDDRSTPQAVLRSYYNAINRKEYARAYYYWESGAAPTQLAPFPQFAAGFTNTASVQLNIGQPTEGVGAGQIYYSVPVAVAALTTDGQHNFFAGCYQLHLARPELQAVPPFHPLAIQKAAISEVSPGSAGPPPPGPCS